MSSRVSTWVLRASVALTTLAPMLAMAQPLPGCGLDGQPPCNVPEPDSLALIGVAVGILVYVARKRRK